MDQLFVGSEVYVSSGRGPYADGSTYGPLQGIGDSQRSALLELLARLGADCFESREALDADVCRVRQWNTIYAELDALLRALPFSAVNGSPTYFIVDYGNGQHKIECEASEYFEPTVLNAIQVVLRRHSSTWEVMLAGGPKLGPQQALSVFPDRVVPHWSNAQWYGDA
ncbi:hypothetical protein HZ992_15260 [Rhizobacter sp. AJA081-3]|uniref:hypothetical protein n=1 Tax=Rhizobacter sp. AJA081-3 TaxID=2753607 RepID=UPI001AE05246|nr:hypothetical protein [Rhizobacter sp. AJA081-3]QTN21539.1 hypothetical protein HZ992_15260 [Rhizobacter sp. AJA081-3]